MHLWIITFFFGICSLMFFAELPSLYWLFILPVMFFAWFIGRSYVSTKAKKIVNHVLVFVFGFCWVLVYAHWITAWSLSQELEGKNLLVTGYISSLPTTKSRHIGFEFKTDTINDEKVSTKLKLSWYGNYPRQLIAGDKWRLLVRLKRPHGTANPGGFDLERHLLVRNIRATGYIVDDESNNIIDSRWYSHPFARLRQHLSLKIKQVLPFDELAPVIIALVTGVTNGIAQSQWEVLRNTGTNYLVAISGLHIGLIASIVLLLVQFLWRRAWQLSLVLPAHEVGVVAGLFMGVLYTAVSGFSVPAQRALIMLIMFSLATLMRRHTQLWNAWLWSLFFVLIIDPLAVLTIGFWLSFTAVAAILYVSGWRIRETQTYLSKFWRMQLTVTIVLLPLTLLFFQQVSLVTLAANLIAMPGVCLIVVPMCLLGALCLFFSNSLGGWVLWLSSKLLHIIWWWLSLLSGFFGCNWYHPIYNWWILVAAGIGALLLCAPRGLPVKCLGLIWLIPIFFYMPAKPKPNEVWFTLLDVGQGLAAVVQTANHVLLYDTGPKFLGHDVGSTIIVPYLRLQGVKTIDRMIVSHGDSDHIGGASSILKVFQVNKILTSVPEKFSSLVAEFCVAGQSWSWDGVDFQMLSPSKNSLLVGNEASCVLKVTQGENSILLTGDIERRAEKFLVNNHREGLNSSILVAPHHGSSTSSSSAFVSLVTPKFVLFPAGYKNRFRFPSKKVVKKYTNIGAKLLNAAYKGAITFKFGGKSDILSPVSYREIKRYFWQDR